MIKKFTLSLSALILILLLAACPDGTTTPETPGDGGDTTLTEEDIIAVIDFISDCMDSREVMDNAKIPDSGVAFDETNGIVTFLNFNISGYSFNTAGFLILSGTYSFGGKGGNIAVNMTVTGSATYHIQYTLDGSDPLSVWVNEVEYAIDYYGGGDSLPEGIPENCYITYDTNTSSVVNTPLWPDESERCDVESHYEYSTASKESSAVTSETPYEAAFSYDGTSYPFYGKAWATADSTGAGDGTLKAMSMLNAEGINFPSASTDMEYQVFGTANHRVYFSAQSDSSDTTRIEVAFTINAQAHLKYSIGSSDDHATSFTSFKADADIYRMGWYETEMEDYEWTDIEFVAGSRNESAGYAVVGFTDTYRGSGTGIFSGDVSSPTTGETTVAGSDIVTCEIQPETEMFMLSLDIMARSIIEFTGIGLGDVGVAEANCYNALMSYSFTACDPDDPDAEITVDFYVPDF